MMASRTRIASALGALGQFHSADAQAEILGAHLEGPFLSPDKAGAQSPKWMVAPDVDLYHEWQAKSCQKVKVVTFAPEIPGTAQFAEQLSRDGVQTSIGHTNCNMSAATAAISCGCLEFGHVSA